MKARDFAVLLMKTPDAEIVDFSIDVSSADPNADDSQYRVWARAFVKARRLCT